MRDVCLVSRDARGVSRVPPFARLLARPPGRSVPGHYRITTASLPHAVGDDVEPVLEAGEGLVEGGHLGLHVQVARQALQLLRG